MAEANTSTGPAEGARKRRKPQGPRQNKPIFAVITYKDEQGNVQSLDKARLTIALERDAAKLLDLVTGEGMSGATVVRAELPVAAKPAAAAGGAASA